MKGPIWFKLEDEIEKKERVVLGREQLSQVWPQNNAVTHQLEDEVGVGLPVFRLHHRRLGGWTCETGKSIQSRRASDRLLWLAREEMPQSAED